MFRERQIELAPEVFARNEHAVPIELGEIISRRPHRETLTYYAFPDNPLSKDPDK
jgi:hypothetical protein